MLKKLKMVKTQQFVRDHHTQIMCGLGFVGGVAATLYFRNPVVIKPAKLFAELSLDPANAAEFPLILGKEAFEALTNDETNFIRFTNDLHPYVFHVSLER